MRRCGGSRAWSWWRREAAARQRAAAVAGGSSAGRRLRRRALEHTWPSSLSGSAAESEAMHAMARLRAAARAEPSSLKRAVRQASDSSSFRWPPKRLSRSLRMSMLSSFTSSVSLATPETSLGASCRTAVTAMACGISSTTVFRPIEQMSRCSSLPVSTCVTSCTMISSTCCSCTLRTSGERHLTARPCTSDDWSLSSLSTHLQILRSPSESGLKVSLESSASRSDVAM